MECYEAYLKLRKLKIIITNDNNRRKRGKTNNSEVEEERKFCILTIIFRSFISEKYYAKFFAETTEMQVKHKDYIMLCEDELK